MKKLRRTLCILGLFFLSGCSVSRISTGKVKDLSYVQIEEADIPEEMRKPIQERQSQPFSLTYADKGKLYIAKGYGKQDTDGYEIQVTEFYESENAIVLKTTFLGPESDEYKDGPPTYPYIVIQTEYSDKYVVAE